MFHSYFYISIYSMDRNKAQLSSRRDFRAPRIVQKNERDTKQALKEADVFTVTFYAHVYRRSIEQFHTDLYVVACSPEKVPRKSDNI